MGAEDPPGVMGQLKRSPRSGPQGRKRYRAEDAVEADR